LGQNLQGEVILLRDTVGKAKEDRETLIRDFRESMKSINEELAQLRECNRRLAEVRRMKEKGKMKDKTN
jgi:predicted nuclease with TOPRIM domain